MDRLNSLPAKKTVTSGQIADSSVSLFSGISETLRSLPGIVTGGDFSGLLFIRGAEPLESVYTLDRSFIAYPYRWGGRMDIFNAKLVDKIELYTGGFPAWVGNTIGGVIDIQYRQGSSEKLKGAVELSPTTLELLFEGPIKKPNFTGIISAKRTHYDLLVKLFRPGNIYPYFNELYGKLDWKAGEKNSFSLFNLYNFEGTTIKMTEQEVRDAGAGTEAFSLDYFYHKNVTALNWKNRISSQWTNETTLTQTLDRINFDLSTPKHPLTFNMNSKDYYWRNDLTWQASKNHLLTSGFFIAYGNALLKYTSKETKVVRENGILKNATTTKELNFPFNRIYYYGVYLWEKWKIFQPLTFDFGSRFEHLQISGKNAFTPRASLSYALTEFTTLKTAAGIYSNFIPDADKYDPLIGNPNLGPQYSTEYLAGLERILKEKYRARVEVYRRDLKDLVVKDRQWNYSNTGKGKAEGIECFLEKKAEENGLVDGWISYSHSQSHRTIGDNLDSYDIGDGSAGREYVQSDPDKFYYSNADRTHGLSVILNWNFKKEWKLSFDFSYIGGKPYTPVAGVLSYADSATGETLYYPVMGEFNSARLPPYHRLDLKLEKEKKVRWGTLKWYLQGLNVYNQANIYGYYYSKDYSQRFNYYMFGFLVLGGIEVQF